MNRHLGLTPIALALLAVLQSGSAAAAETVSFDTLAAEYTRAMRPLLVRLCLDCHSTEATEGELDLERFGTLAEIRRDGKPWLKVVEMLDSGEMPPKDAQQPTPEERRLLRGWLDRYLNAEAYASAGDPGPVVLRRLCNAEYTYTIRDLTGVPLSPAREFPADSAAGEGFTNTGAALVMSPALLTKYFDAGKEIAGHAVLLPDGIRFSASTARRDWTDEILNEIRHTYRTFSDPSLGGDVHLHGLTWENNEGGALPLVKYIAATLDEREALTSGQRSLAAVAQQRGLNAKYLTSLWNILTGPQPTQILSSVRSRWSAAEPDAAAAVAAEVGVWQKALTTFQSVGHMKSWMAPVNPLADRQDFRIQLKPPASGNEIKLYFATGAAGDGREGDLVVWQQPRLVTPGRPDVPLRDLRSFVADMRARRQRVFGAAAAALTAVDDATSGVAPLDVPALAAKHKVDVTALTAWLDYFGVRSATERQLDHLTGRIEKAAGYDFVRGWGSLDTPSLMTNASDQHVRVPGNLRGRGVAVHPSPTLKAAIGWQSPVAGPVHLVGQVTHAHPECGNGVTWSLELRRASTRRVLASGVVQGATPVAVGPVESLAVQPGDLVSLLIGPRDGDHGCDLTDVELTFTGGPPAPKTWNLSADVAGDILAGNPHADRLGNAGVWHFYREPVAGPDARPAIPADSVLAQWQAATPGQARQKLAAAVQALLTAGPPADAKHPDAVLYRQLASLGGPLFAGAKAASPDGAASADIAGSTWGLDPALFGRHVDGTPIDAGSLCVQAPSVIEVRLPADWVAGSELVTGAVLDTKSGGEGSVQALIVPAVPADLAGLHAGVRVITTDGSQARRRFEKAFDDFRQWFPAALCYIRIVPVDEVVTLTLLHREDEPLCRLMLDEKQRAQLDRLWEQLHFVSQDALTLVDAFAQLMEYATQDSDPKLFEPFRKPIHDRAAAFRQELLAAEPRHLQSVVDLAGQAYRRPLAPAEADELRSLYGRLREQELPHDEAIRYLLARIFVSPAFLYRLERSPPGEKAAPVSDWELASRLSYFLWSSQPDAELRSLAAAGRLGEPAVLAAQTRRLLADARVRRLATEFACQWLQVYEFDMLDEKSERHFPTFGPLRGDMYEEVIQFFTDIALRDRAVLSLLDADHTFVNEALASHYGIPGPGGPQFCRVEGLRAQGRGGILGMAAVLAKQSGASRTSPILRGNWVSEVLLGEKLPRPPKDVPPLPDDDAATAELTVRQLVEKHVSDERCGKCHVRIDPLGFALEGFDAIGRRRLKDLADRPIDNRARLQDGTQFADLSGLRGYLLTTRRDAVLRQFCKKLLGYALGRGVQLSDEPLLREMIDKLRQDDRFSVAVSLIVSSPQFQQIRGQASPLAEAQ
jgi:hypothetical protein